MKFESVCVMGLGYIGLPTAAMFASKNKHVFGVDVNQNTVDIINRGDIHISEPDLEQLVYKAVNAQFLTASLQPKEADIFIIAVPTPFKKEISKVPEPDLFYIKEAVRAIAPFLRKGNLVILESTSPVGTTELIAEWLSEIRTDLRFPNENSQLTDISIAYCPERVLPGQIINELVSNDRVIGGLTTDCSERAVSVYRTFSKGDCIRTTARVAEMVKLTENASRDVQIAFANELSVLCDELSIDVWELISIANRHPRVNILNPGPGVGGHCIAVDPWFIVNQAPNQSKLIKMAREVNDAKPNWVVEKIKNAIAELLLADIALTADKISVTFFGLTFKPNVDDTRNSPAMEIVQQFTSIHPGSVVVVEPNLELLPSSLSERAKIADLKHGFETGDLHVWLVNHSAFDSINYQNYPNKKIVDICGIRH